MMFPGRGQPDLLKNMSMKKWQEAAATAEILKEKTHLRWCLPLCQHLCWGTHCHGLQDRAAVAFAIPKMC